MSSSEDFYQAPRRKVRTDWQIVSVLLVYILNGLNERVKGAITI